MLDNSNIPLLSLLDLPAAFNTIDHFILLSRLQTCLVFVALHFLWFESYFSDWFQSVSVIGVLSSSLLHGVLQGYGLDIFLFVLYTCPVFTIVNAYSLSHRNISDDSQLCVAYPAFELPMLVFSA